MRSSFIPLAFSHTAWDQILLSTPGIMTALIQIKSIYKEDELFQKYLHEDYKRHFPHASDQIPDEMLDFFLEEHVVIHYIQNFQTKIRNEFTN